MTRIGIQLATLRSLDEPVPAQLERVGGEGLDGVEFGRLDDTALEDIATALDRAGLEAATAQVALDELEDEYETITETYRQLGCRRLVVANLDPPPFSSLEAMEDVVRRLSAVGDRLDEDGFELLYHDDFRDVTDVDEVATFVDSLSPTVGLQLDTGRAVHGGIDPVKLLDRYPERIPVVHLTDAAHGGDNTLRVELGAGEVDLERCVGAARATGVEWLVYEHPQTDDPVDSLVHAATLLPQLCERVETSQA
jgi:sugar phosphate isomerase/epimerase